MAVKSRGSGRTVRTLSEPNGEMAVRWRAGPISGALILSTAAWLLPAQRGEVFRAHGGPGTDVGNSIISIPGGYAVLGYTDGPSGSQREAWLLRLDERLDTLWTRRYGGPTETHGWGFALTATGTFLIAGFQQSARGDDDVWVLHVDAQGTVIWERTFGGRQDERAWAITLLPGGDALILAETESFGTGKEDVYLARLNMQGDTVWTRHAGGPGTDRAFSIAPHRDGALFVGMSDSGGTARDILLGFVSPDGRVRLEVLPGESGDAIAHGVSPLPGGGFLVTGYGSSANSTANDVIFLRLDAEGGVVDRRVIEGPEDERAMMSAISSDGLVGTVGYAQEDGDWNLTLYQGTPSDLGATRWAHVWPGDGRGVMATPAIDGGWVVTGTIQDGADPGQLVVLKVVR